MHQDVDPDLCVATELVGALMQQPSSLPEGQQGEVRIRDMKECIGPYSFVYSLEDSKMSIVVETQDGVLVSKRINFGEAFLFSGFMRHAGAKHLPNNHFRLHGHVDVKGLNRKKGQAGCLVNGLFVGIGNSATEVSMLHVACKRGPRKRTQAGRSLPAAKKQNVCFSFSNRKVS